LFKVIKRCQSRKREKDLEFFAGQENDLKDFEKKDFVACREYRIPHAAMHQGISEKKILPGTNSLGQSEIT